MIQFDFLSAPPLQLLGFAGAGLYILNYATVTLRLSDTESVGYFLRNLAAALMVLLSLGHAFNAAALVIQVFFIAVSLCGIATRLRRSRPARAPVTPAVPLPSAAGGR
ncbi:MAG: hypothetical protein WBA25_01240 [Jannaschia sp.]